MNQVEAYNLLHTGSLALFEAEQNGIRVDMEYLETKTAHMTRKMEYFSRKFKESKFYSDWAKIQDKEPNPNSAVQLRNYLYEVKKYKIPKFTDKGFGSTDKESLLALNIPELNMLLEEKRLKKNRDYLIGFKREQTDGWLHPNFNLHLVKTFRSSSDHPNFQNIPKRDKEAMRLTRRALFPRKGHQLMEVDYGSLEVRIAACYHKDPTMLKYIRDGYDMHGDMCNQIFLLNGYDKENPEHGFLRGATKNGFVFPQFYGDYFKNCAENMACQWGELPSGKWKEGQGVPFGTASLGDHMLKSGFNSLDQFTKHVKEIEEDFWGRRFKAYAKWKERWWAQYQKVGYVDLLTGFQCRGSMKKNDAINYPIQGAAFHCLLWSFIELNKYLKGHGFRSRVIGQVHDSIVLDVHPEEFDELIGIIRKITTVDLPKAWPWIITPLDVDFEYCEVDAPWSEKKELKN